MRNQAGDTRPETRGTAFQNKTGNEATEDKTSGGTAEGGLVSVSAGCCISSNTEQCDGNTIITVFLWFAFPTRD